MKRILITGGAGFVGANLAIFLKDRLEHVHIIAFDNLHRRGSELNLARLQLHSIEFVHGDIRVESDLQSVGPCDWLIECSAEPSVLAGVSTPIEYAVQSNLVGAIHCLNWAKRHHAGFLFLSTSRVYPYSTLNEIPYVQQETRLSPDFDNVTITGLSHQGIAETFPLQGYRTLYGATKLASEYLALEYADMFDIPVIINRCSVIGGPWQMGRIDQGIIALWLAYHYAGKSLSYIGYGGEGKQVRDALHINDLCELILYQIQHFGKFNRKIFNVGGGIERSFSLKELTALCEKTTGKNVSIQSVPNTRYGDVPYFITDTALIQRVGEWKPRYSLIQIVEDTYRWICDNESLLKGILLPN